MKGGANIVDIEIIRKAVEAGTADAKALSAELQVPVDVVESFVQHFGSRTAKAEDEAPKKKKTALFGE